MQKKWVSMTLALVVGVGAAGGCSGEDSKMILLEECSQVFAVADESYEAEKILAELTTPVAEAAGLQRVCTDFHDAIRDMCSDYMRHGEPGLLHEFATPLLEELGDEAEPVLFLAVTLWCSQAVFDRAFGEYLEADRPRIEWPPSDDGG